MVHRKQDVDQILRFDLPDLKPTLIFQTNRVPDVAAKKKFRQYISYLAWKSETTLVVSVSQPVNLELGDYSEIVEAPVHLILKASGESEPLLINEKKRGKSATVEISWIQDVLRDDPDHVMIGFRKSVDELELDRVDIATGQRLALERGDRDVSGWGTDRKGNIVTRYLEDEFDNYKIQARKPSEKTWTTIFNYRRKDERELSKYRFLGVGEVGVLYVASKPDSSADGDTESVRTFDLKTLKLGPIIWSNPKYDVDEIVQDVETGEILAGCYWVDVYQCDFKDTKLAAHMRGLKKYFDNKRNVSIVSQSYDDKKWVLSVGGPEEPATYYLYDVEKHEVLLLGERWPDLNSNRLGAMRRFDFKSRDGAELSAYVTTPPHPSGQPMPLIVMPHGGPEARDAYAYDTWVHFLAAQGYAVLQPNFRGSGGFGRKFAEAGYGEWGGRMHNDVMDATKALIAEGKIDPARVCIVGASYGGYEALYAGAAEPATFHCVVSVAGISDLVGNMRWEKSFGRDSVRYTYWLKSQGDPDLDSAKMLGRSPYRLASQYRVPVLLIHGTKDQIVPAEESRQMKRALEGAGKSVKYLEVSGMGHGPRTDEETTKVLTEIQTFLAAQLQPPTGAAAAESKP